MKRFIYFLSVIFLILACNKKKNPEPVANNNDYSGVYMGSTTEIYQSDNATYGYKKSDTTYVDSIIVKQKDDSISFILDGVENKFKKDTSDNYMTWIGTHSNYQFRFEGSDSLKYSYWSYGGYSSSYNQENIDFKGKKK